VHLRFEGLHSKRNWCPGGANRGKNHPVQKLGTRHAFSPPHWEENLIVFRVLLFTGSISKPPAAAYAQRASSALSTIPAGLADIGTVAPYKSETSQRSRFEICPSWQIRNSSLELCLTPQAVTHRAEVSDPVNYTTQAITVSCGRAVPTSRVFHTPPRKCTVSDETHRPAQRVNLLCPLDTNLCFSILRAITYKIQSRRFCQGASSQP
jgi:hypothetical protein